MDITQDHKNEIEKKIVETIALSLENNTLQQNELSDIASFVLDRMDQVKNHEELILFLSELSSKWPIFGQIEAIEKGEVKEQKEEQAFQNVLDLAKSGKIDEAVNLAKEATNGDIK